MEFSKELKAYNSKKLGKEIFFGTIPKAFNKKRSLKS